MKDVGINHSVYGILNRVGDISLFLEDAVSLIAAICLAMSIGMLAVKVFLGGANAKNELIKSGLSIVVFIILFNLYGPLMNGVYKVATNLGYASVFSSGKYTVEIPNGVSGKSVSGYYEFLDEVSGGLFSFTGDGAKKALNLNLIDAKTGFLDLNKTFKFAYVMVRALFKSLPGKINIFTSGAILMLFTFLLALITSLACFFLCLANYVTCLIDFFALKGFGILMLPMSLWDGMKSYTSGLFGSIGRIFMKLLLISSFLFLSIMAYLDCMLTLYLKDVSSLSNFVLGYTETCLDIIFISIVCFILTKNTTAISGFLMGGNPQMSFGEFVHAAMQTGASIAGAMMGTKSGMNAMSDAKGALSSAITTGAMDGATVGGMAREANGGSGGIGSGIMTGLASGGKSLVGSLTNGAIGAVSGAGAALGGVGKVASGALGIRGSMSSEGFYVGGSGGRLRGGGERGTEENSGVSEKLGLKEQLEGKNIGEKMQVAKENSNFGKNVNNVLRNFGINSNIASGAENVINKGFGDGIKDTVASMHNQHGSTTAHLTQKDRENPILNGMDGAKMRVVGSEDTYGSKGEDRSGLAYQIEKKENIISESSSSNGEGEGIEKEGRLQENEDKTPPKNNEVKEK